MSGAVGGELGGATLLLATAGIADAVELARRCARELPGASPVELVESDGVEHVADARGTHPPLAGRALLLLDCSWPAGTERLLRDRVVGWPEVRGVLVASEPAERSALWSWRRLLPDVLRASGAARPLSVPCPAHVLAEALRAVRAELLARAPGVQLVAYGAVLDGTVDLVLLGKGSGCPDVERAVRAAVRTRVREVAGSVERVHPTVVGTVVRGDGRGRAIGFPTANVAARAPVELPDDGVYAGTVELADGSRHAAAISVGRRPTYYDDGELLLEAHLLDFDGDLYGQLVRVEIGTRVRGQLRFASTQDLVVQIERDVAAVRAERPAAAGAGPLVDDGRDGQG